jgi:hypothetical protein
MGAGQPRSVRSQSPKSNGRSSSRRPYPLYAVHYPIFLLISGVRHKLFPGLIVEFVMAFGIVQSVLAATFISYFYDIS